MNLSFGTADVNTVAFIASDFVHYISTEANLWVFDNTIFHDAIIWSPGHPKNIGKSLMPVGQPNVKSLLFEDPHNSSIKFV